MKHIVVLILTVLLLAGCTKTQSISGNIEPQTPVTEETVQEESVQKESVQEKSHTVALEDSTIVVESSEEPQPEDSNPEEPIKNENAEKTDPEIAGGTTLEEAQMLEPGIRYTGEYEEGYLWVGFTTGAEEEVPYYITLTNLTVGSDDLELYMFDASETQVNPVARNNDGYYKPFCVAKQNGIAAYGMSDELQNPSACNLLRRMLGRSLNACIRLSTFRCYMVLVRQQTMPDLPLIIAKLMLISVQRRI